LKRLQYLLVLIMRIICLNQAKPLKRQAIMAIQGLTVVSITADNPASLDNENIKDVTKLLGLDYVVRVEKIYLGRETQLSVQLVCNIDNVVLWTKKYQLEESSDQALSEWPAASAINATIEIANVSGKIGPR